MMMMIIVVKTIVIIIVIITYMSMLYNMEAELEKRVVGQEEAAASVARAMILVEMISRDTCVIIEILVEIVEIVEIVVLY